MANVSTTYIYIDNFSELFPVGGSEPLIFSPSEKSSGVPDYRDYSELPNEWFTKCNSSYDNEREFFQKTQMEVYNTYGVSCYYYKLNYDISASDRIFAEQNDRVIDEYWSDVSTYFQLPRENKVFSKFGMSDLNNFSMYISKEHFEYITSGHIPKIGDLIQSEYNSNIYEIVEVKSSKGMYLMDQRFTWELIVKHFVDERIAIAGDVSASPLSGYTDKQEDILDITNPIDAVKEDVIYKPTSAEKGSGDIFGNWG
jgi:hypothetical protein